MTSILEYTYMTQVQKKKEEEKEMDFQEFAGKVAVGATGVALAAGMVAVGAALFADDKTKAKLAKDTQQAATNFRGFIEYVKKTAETTKKTIKEIV